MKQRWLLKKTYALPIRGFWCNEGDYTWEDWHEENKKKYPVRYFLQEDLTMWFRVKIRNRVSNAWYWLRTHLWNRYHIINISNKANKYNWGWIECDQAILYACFKILSNFVEKEMKYNCYYVPATEHCPEWDQRETEKEIRALYQWWTEERPKELETERYYGAGEAGDAKDNEMLERLLKIRKNLWS